MDRPMMTAADVETLRDARFLKLYDLHYAEGKHYFSASRRAKEELVAVKRDEAFRSMLPDAVTIAVILKVNDDEPKLLLNYEYRYPVGQFLLSPIAGLLDPEDKDEADPLRSGAIREIFEETGITVKDSDTVKVLNPCAFSTPGMSDESNAFLAAEISLSDTSVIDQSGAVGTELFNGFELLSVTEAKKVYESGRDRFGNTYSLATWAVLGWFTAAYDGGKR